MSKKVLFFLLFTNFYTFAQFNPTVPWMSSVEEAKTGKATIYQLENAFNDYWKSHDRTKKGSGFKPFMRWDYHWKNKTNPQGFLITPAEMWTALNQKNASKTSRNPALLPASNWQPLGPFGNATAQSTMSRGRVGVVFVDPSNPNTIYMGTPAGGIWKSLNAGTSWTSMSDNLPQIGVSGIAVDPNNSNIIYIATGDNDSSDTYSIGVMKSIDGGITWSTTGLTFTGTNATAGDIICNPTNSAMLWVATSSGIYRTINSGSSWTMVQSGNFAQGRIRLKPDDATTVYAVNGNRFYRSTNSGASFTTVTTGLPSSSGRMLLDVTAANPNYIYIFSVTTSNAFQGIYRSVNAGNNWVKTSGTTNVVESTQAWYDLAFAVSATNADELYTGCLNIWKSTNGGVTATKVNDWSTYNSKFTHADIHFLRFYGDKLYCGSDGGIFVSQDNATTFTDKTGEAQISQIYKLSVSKQSASKIAAGLQDNGGYAFGNNLWRGYHGGDGMDNAIDPTNSNLFYGFLYYGGTLFVSNNSGVSTTSTVAGPSGETGNWVTPMKTNSVGELFSGFSNLYRLNGGAWVQQSVSGLNGGNLELIAIDPTDDTIMFVSNGGNLFKSTDKGINFTQVYSATSSITAIEINATTNSIVYLTTQGTNGTVLKSINGGTTFTNFGTGIPNIGKNVIVHQAHHSKNPLYVGTSLGVYYRDDTLSQWTPFDTNLPNVSVSDLEINLNDEKIIASTYGRGAWEAAIPYEIMPNDIKIESVQSPSAQITCDGVYLPQVLITNRGSNTVNSITLNYQYNGTPMSFIWTGTLNSSDSVAIDLPPIVTEAGSYTLNVVASIANDDVPGNNESNTLFYVNNPGNPSVTNTFETGTPNLISYNDAGIIPLWQKGVCTKTLLTTVANGNQVYATNLTGNYPDQTVAYLVSQCYDLTQVTNPYIKFNLAFDLQNKRDVLFMQYSTNFGATWTTLGNASNLNWYNTNSVPGAGGAGCALCIGSQWTGRNLTPLAYTLPLNFLSNETNVIFRFVFHSNESVNYEGATIDNFVIDGSLKSQDFDLEKMAIYPNPSQAIFNVSFGNAIPKSLEVYDISGKIIVSKNDLKNNQKNIVIDLSKAATGIYFLKFSTENQTITKRIIKK